VCSRCQGNLVFIHYINYVNTIVKFIQQLYSKVFYYKPQICAFSSEATSSKLSYDSTNELNPYYVTGFTDGEVCFSVSVSANLRYKTGYRVKAAFHIGLHIRDLALLKQIQLFFGVGNITKLGVESVQFRVSGLEALKVIINPFDKYPLVTNKQSDYILLKKRGIFYGTRNTFNYRRFK